MLYPVIVVARRWKEQLIKVYWYKWCNWYCFAIINNGSIFTNTHNRVVSSSLIELNRILIHVYYQLITITIFTGNSVDSSIHPIRGLSLNKKVCINLQPSLKLFDSQLRYRCRGFLWMYFTHGSVPKPILEGNLRVTWYNVFKGRSFIVDDATLQPSIHADTR